MGGGKRNYNSMQQQYRKAPKEKTEEIQIEKKLIAKEDIDNLLGLWQQSKEKLKKEKSSEKS